jgi:hypothetical protein
LRGLEWKSPYEIMETSCANALDMIHDPLSSRKVYYSRLIREVNPELLAELEPLSPFVDSTEVSYPLSFCLG